MSWMYLNVLSTYYEFYELLTCDRLCRCRSLLFYIAYCTVCARFRSSGLGPNEMWNNNRCWFEGLLWLIMMIYAIMCLMTRLNYWMMTPFYISTQRPYQQRPQYHPHCMTLFWRYCIDHRLWPHLSSRLLPIHPIYTTPHCMTLFWRNFMRQSMGRGIHWGR